MNARILFNSCPLCGSKKLANGAIGDCSNHPRYISEIPALMQWMDCQDCSHQFINGYFSDEALELIFSSVGERQTVGFDIENHRKLSANIIEKVLPYQNMGTWLDVGFGNGSLLFTAQEFGFKTIGVDLRSQNVEAMKQLGFDAYCADLQELTFKQEIAVASLMDVLEHVPYPKTMLNHLYTIMQENACLLLSMPNSENLLWKVMTEQDKNPYLGELEHYHNFSRTRLIKLLDECGFDMIRYGISERYRCCMEIVAIRQ